MKNFLAVGLLILSQATHAANPISSLYEVVLKTAKFMEVKSIEKTFAVENIERSAVSATGVASEAVELGAHRIALENGVVLTLVNNSKTAELQHALPAGSRNFGSTPKSIELRLSYTESKMSLDASVSRARHEALKNIDDDYVFRGRFSAEGIKVDLQNGKIFINETADAGDVNKMIKNIIEALGDI